MAQRRRLVSVLIGATALFPSSPTWADVPAPPVNQSIGMLDVELGTLTEVDCRLCHDPGVPDRHHLLYDQLVSDPSLVPYPQFNIPNPGGDLYSCMSCHSDTFALERDCLQCHDYGSPHHATPAARSGDCVSCHGDIVDNMDDGHYIPTYEPSLVTPARSRGDGLPLNSRGNGAGACNYCHDDDGLSSPVILSNERLHHSVRDKMDCSWCHDFGPFEGQIRTCEGCHGPDSLHNIQADSPRPEPGTIVVGGEDAGYGHVGRDAGPGDSDCWGCHGFSTAFAPGSGPIVPVVHAADRAVIDAGIDTVVTLTGSSFTNIAGTNQYVSEVALTAADGSSMSLTPDVADQGSMSVTIPGETAPGNYDVQAVKEGPAGEDVASNPAVISITPQVVITSATGDSTVTIEGSGFGGFAAGSGTSVTGTVTRSNGSSIKVKTVDATIISWSDTTIEADFGARTAPDEVTVNSVFGSDTSQVRRRGSASGKKN